MGTERLPGRRLVLAASPLLGPAVWAPVADALTALGREVLLLPAVGRVTGPDDVLARWLPALPEDAPLVLVPHSNAGLYAAALATRRDVRGTVFVDAGLPGAPPATPTAAPALRAFLAALADRDGLLPGWTRWWPEEEVAGLFPDARTRAAVEAEQARLPLAYFEAAVDSPAGWEQRPAAYLAFGDTYAEERAAARARGWPTRTLAGGHLHPLVAPGEVAEALVGLLGSLGPEPGGPDSRSAGDFP